MVIEWVSIVIGVALKWMVYGENPIKMDDLEVPLFQETSICTNIIMYVCSKFKCMHHTFNQIWSVGLAAVYSNVSCSEQLIAVNNGQWWLTVTHGEINGFHVDGNIMGISWNIRGVIVGILGECWWILPLKSTIKIWIWGFSENMGQTMTSIDEPYLMGLKRKEIAIGNYHPK